MKEADIVLYDRLVGDLVADVLPHGVRAICVGVDHGKDPADKQKRINSLMLESARKGLKVARVKSGDPFLFGRGGEEVGYLAEHGIDYEIIPGVSSALGVPTSAGIPLTHRNLSSSVFIISGHRKKGEEYEWDRMAGLKGTIVILMGIGRIREITKMLQDGGMSPEMPVAVIQNGTLRNQRTITGRLSGISDTVEKKEIVSPGIIVIGEVVKTARIAELENMAENVQEELLWDTYQ